MYKLKRLFGLEHRRPFGANCGQIEYMQITKMTGTIEMYSAGVCVNVSWILNGGTEKRKEKNRTHVCVCVHGAYVATHDVAWVGRVEAARHLGDRH